LLVIKQGDGSEIVPFGRRSLALLSAILLVLWIPRAFDAPHQSTNGLLTQREVLEIQGPKEYEVFYPRPFSSVPNLNFSKMVDGNYFYVDYDVIQQRPDGFKISVTSSETGSAIEWVAVGLPEINDRQK